MHLLEIAEDVEHVLVHLHSLTFLNFEVEVGLAGPAGLQQLRPSVLQNFHELLLDAHDVRL